MSCWVVYTRYPEWLLWHCGIGLRHDDDGDDDGDDDDSDGDGGGDYGDGDGHLTLADLAMGAWHTTGAGDRPVFRFLDYDGEAKEQLEDDEQRRRTRRTCRPWSWRRPQVLPGQREPQSQRQEQRIQTLPSFFSSLIFSMSSHCSGWALNE